MICWGFFKSLPALELSGERGGGGGGVWGVCRGSWLIGEWTSQTSVKFLREKSSGLSWRGEERRGNEPERLSSVCVCVDDHTHPVSACLRSLYVSSGSIKTILTSTNIWIIYIKYILHLDITANFISWRCIIWIMSHTWMLGGCRYSGWSEGGAVEPKLTGFTLLRHKLIMHIALHSDRTD